MSLQPCCVHGEKVSGKLATMFAAWQDAEYRRVSYKLKLCAPCLTKIMGSLLAHRSAESSNLTVCPTCGQDSSQRLDPLYLTVYPPKQEGREYALTTCTGCAPSYRGSFSDVGDLQPDRFNGNSMNTEEWKEVPW